MESFYDVLGVDPGAAPHAIKAAYHAAALQLHPDKQGQQGQQGGQQEEQQSQQQARSDGLGGSHATAVMSTAAAFERVQAAWEVSVVERGAQELRARAWMHARSMQARSMQALNAACVRCPRPQVLRDSRLRAVHDRELALLSMRQHIAFQEEVELGDMEHAQGGDGGFDSRGCGWGDGAKGAGLRVCEPPHTPSPLPPTRLLARRLARVPLLPMSLR